MTLDAANFLCRFFLHVLPKGLRFRLSPLVTGIKPFSIELPLFCNTCNRGVLGSFAPCFWGFPVFRASFKYWPRLMRPGSAQSRSQPLRR